MPHKNLILDFHAFTNKSVTGDFAPTANFGALLDFDESPYFRVVPDFATIEVGESKNAHIAPKLDAGGYLLVVVRDGIHFRESEGDMAPPQGGQDQIITPLPRSRP